jgi:mRNA-degrading endonuclease RelE of RelBE toxin-antitoxin system
LIPNTTEISFETSVSKLMENLSKEERNMLEQLIEAVETDSTHLTNIHVSKNYIN